MGWTDSVLLERRELTSGSTWHSAGNTTYFGPYPAMTRLFAGSIRTYLQAEEESGQSVSLKARELLAIRFDRIKNRIKRYEAKSMRVFPNLSTEEIEAQYQLRNTRPDYEVTMIPDWQDRSEKTRSEYKHKKDLRYGDLARNTLDYFAPLENNNRCVLYIHGGYWQRGDKSIYHFMAEPLLERGFNVAVMNYQMCPDVRMAEIIPQVRNAVSYLWSHAHDLKFDASQLNICGHSAGAHLTAEMMFTDWHRHNKSMPVDSLHAGVAVSGIYDFHPILQCSENTNLKMDLAEAIDVSTINRTPINNKPLVIAHGLNEPFDMHRQSADLFNKVRQTNPNAHFLAIPDADHFETVNVLADQHSELFASTLAAFS